MIPGTRALESRLAAVFEKAAQTVAGAGSAQPLELVERAVDDIARQVHPAGRGRYAFPFNDIAVTFVAPSADMQIRFETICAGPPSLQERVVRRLEAAGCRAVDVDVRVAFTEVPAADWSRPELGIALARVEPAARVPRGPDLRLELVVAHGTADRGAYSFRALPIAIGRGQEARDSRQQLLRVNHVAFTEGADEINQSVSRRHARIELDPLTGRPRIIDDNSAQGTAIIRDGRGLVVPRGSRGLGLRSGDEIVLGQARLRVTIA